MPRINYRDAISQAVNYINEMSSLKELGENAIKQGVVLRVLSAAGWDTFDLTEVQPDYRTGNSKVDFALMAGASGRAKSNVTPHVLVEVKSLNENLESDRFERQMVASCNREGVPLAVLTNGTKWLLLYSSEESKYKESRFCEIDLTADQDASADDINRFLAKDRVSSGQAARSAERALEERNQDEVTRKAVLDGWRQVVRGLDEGLVELIAIASEQRAGHRPDNRFVRRVLMEHRADLLPSASDDLLAAESGGRGSSRRRPASFTFESETRNASSWPDLLIGVCELMRERHSGDFERILDIRGRTLPYFSKSEDSVHLPREIGNTGIYASCQGAGVLIEGRAKKVVESFGYSRDLLSIQTR